MPLVFISYAARPKRNDSVQSHFINLSTEINEQEE